MLRLLLALLACLSLAGCWVSEKRIFGAGDWAHVPLAGKYISQDANGHDTARVTLKVRADGVIEGTGVNIADGSPDNSVIALVPIKGGSGRYFLAVDRSKDEDSGDIYLIAHLTDDNGLEVFWPDCEGTAPIAGMAVTRDNLTESVLCQFSSKDALMAAGLQAEKFLSAKHVVAIAPLGRLVPDDGDDDEEDSADDE
jgi:hypothetical protein